MMAVAGTFLLVVIQYSDATPLPAESPIGGPLWSVVIPAILLAVASLGTLLLYRHFSRRED